MLFFFDIQRFTTVSEFDQNSTHEYLFDLSRYRFSDFALRDLDLSLRIRINNFLYSFNLFTFVVFSKINYFLFLFLYFELSFYPTKSFLSSDSYRQIRLINRTMFDKFKRYSKFVFDIYSRLLRSANN